MAIKGQSNNQVNLDPRVIDVHNDNMLGYMQNISVESKSVNTQNQTFIGNMQGDIKTPYQQLYELIQYRKGMVEQQMRSRINKNKNYVKDMRSTQPG